jgi:hypothetical protein
LIAVSCNLRAVTIFAHGYTLFQDAGDKEASSFHEGTLRFIELQAIGVGDHKFTHLVDGDIAGRRNNNYVSIQSAQQHLNIPMLLKQ